MPVISVMVQGELGGIFLQNVLMDLLDQMLELVYVADVETHELLYINSA